MDSLQFAFGHSTRTFNSRFDRSALARPLYPGVLTGCPSFCPSAQSCPLPTDIKEYNRGSTPCQEPNFIYLLLSTYSSASHSVCGSLVVWRAATVYLVRPQWYKLGKSQKSLDPNGTAKKQKCKNLKTAKATYQLVSGKAFKNAPAQYIYWPSSETEGRSP